MARLSLYGMLQYDNTLLSEYPLPDGIDREILNQTIIARSGDLYPYYQTPIMLKSLFFSWFMGHLSEFTKLYQAMTAEYNPIENYDRRESTKRTLTDSGTDTETTDLGAVSTQKKSGTDRGTQQTTLDQETTEQVSASDADTFQNATRTSVIGTPEQTLTNTYDTTVTDTQSGANTRKTDYGRTNTDEYESHMHGNIGVTTSQQMLEAEIALRTKYNIYQIIAALFEREFIVQLY